MAGTRRAAGRAEADAGVRPGWRRVGWGVGRRWDRRAHTLCTECNFIAYGYRRGCGWRAGGWTTRARSTPEVGGRRRAGSRLPGSPGCRAGRTRTAAGRAAEAGRGGPEAAGRPRGRAPRAAGGRTAGRVASFASAPRRGGPGRGRGTAGVIGGSARAGGRRRDGCGRESAGGDGSRRPPDEPGRAAGAPAPPRETALRPTEAPRGLPTDQGAAGSPTERGNRWDSHRTVAGTPTSTPPLSAGCSLVPSSYDR